MKQLVQMFWIVVAIVVLGGCSLQRSPLVNSVDISKIDFSNSAAFKASEACATYVFGFGPFGDPSVMAAIRAGGIQSVKAVEYRNAWYLLVSKECVVVYGE